MICEPTAFPYLSVEAVEGHDGPEEEEGQVEIVLEQVSKGVAAVGVGTALQREAGAAKHREAAASVEQDVLKIKGACYKPTLEGDSKPVAHQWAHVSGESPLPASWRSWAWSCQVRLALAQQHNRARVRLWGKQPPYARQEEKLRKCLGILKRQGLWGLILPLHPLYLPRDQGVHLEGGQAGQTKGKAQPGLAQE